MAAGNAHSCTQIRMYSSRPITRGLILLSTVQRPKVHASTEQFAKVTELLPLSNYISRRRRENVTVDRIGGYRSTAEQNNERHACSRWRSIVVLILSIAKRHDVRRSRWSWDILTRWSKGGSGVEGGGENEKKHEKGKSTDFISRNSRVTVEENVSFVSFSILFSPFSIRRSTCSRRVNQVRGRAVAAKDTVRSLLLSIRCISMHRSVARGSTRRCPSSISRLSMRQRVVPGDRSIRLEMSRQ